MYSCIAISNFSINYLSFYCQSEKLFKIFVFQKKKCIILKHVPQNNCYNNINLIIIYLYFVDLFIIAQFHRLKLKSLSN